MNLLQLSIEFIIEFIFYENNAGFDEQLADFKVKLILTKICALLELVDRMTLQKM